MLVKSKEHFDHAKHLQEAFELLRRYDMKLNPLKCAFGVSASKFLGFMVTQRGIEANPIQLKTIMDSQIPTSKKGVQQLTDRLVALGQFISRFTNRLKPFFITLKEAKGIGWNEECDQALIVIKLSVSTTLFKEDENRKQGPIFFISKSLAEAETRYTRLEQAALALRVAANKLRPYFQAHTVIVLTNLPLRNTIHKLDLSRRMAWWAINLSEFGIQYKPHLTLKG